MSTSTSTGRLAEPAAGEIRVVHVYPKGLDTQIVQRVDDHPNTNGSQRWFDLACPPDEREPIAWDEYVTADVHRVQVLGEPVNPAETPEPGEGTWLAVNRRYTTPQPGRVAEFLGDDIWYLLHHVADADMPTRDEAIESEWGDDEPSVTAPERKEFEDTIAAFLAGRWKLNYDYAEWSDWGMPERLTWSTLAVEPGDNPHGIEITVYVLQDIPTTT